MPLARPLILNLSRRRRSPIVRRPMYSKTVGFLQIGFGFGYFLFLFGYFVAANRETCLHVQNICARRVSAVSERPQTVGNAPCCAMYDKQSKLKEQPTICPYCMRPLKALFVE